jgi:hypothetical protein
MKTRRLKSRISSSRKKLLAKQPLLFKPGLRCFAAVGLLALLVPAAPAAAADSACVLDTEVAAGLIAIDAEHEADGTGRIILRYALESDLVGADGSRAGAAFFGIARLPLTREALPQMLDNLMVTLRFGDAQQIDAPTLIYYTRDNTIPIDIAPGKLWYPDLHGDSGRLEIVVSLGDLERDMQFGAGEEPANVLSWVAVRVGTLYDNDNLIDHGEIPLTPIRSARAAMQTALERVLVMQENGAC